MICAETQQRKIAFPATIVRVKTPYDYKERLRRAGKSQIGLAKHLQISKDSANRLVNGRRAAEAGEHELAVAYIEGAVADEGPRFRQLNVFGYAAARSDRIAIAENRVIDRMEVPEGMVRGEAFGVRIAGDSMEPRLFAGETVIVGKDLSPSKYGDCVVEFKDGTAIVKQYRGRKDGMVFLWQFNPEEEVRVPAGEISHIHAVLYRK